LAARNKWDAFNAGLIDALSLVHLLLAPIAVGVLVLREPLVRIVYQRGTFDTVAAEQTVWAVLFLSLGVGISTMRDLVSRAFCTMQDTVTPAVLGFITVMINVALNLLLVGPLEQGGLALATTLASLVGLMASLLVLKRKSSAALRLRALLGSMARTGLAALGMGIVTWMMQARIFAAFPVHGATMELAMLIPIVGISAAVYAGLAWILRVPCFGMVVEMALQVFRRIRWLSRF
jgi:putative peptidoglycan lipid II flippase